ncbi:MAG: sodium/glutamate symporter [Akkermansia sp.]
MTSIGIFTLLCLFLVAGKLVRSLCPLLQRLYLPSSVIGGGLGLLTISLFPELVPAEWVDGMKMLPGFLINIVFASLFLGKATPGIKKVFRLALPQLCCGQLLAWGQYVLGLGLTALLLMPVFGVKPAFGNLLEIGFQGGHGTVGGMSESMLQYQWADGIALGYTVATVGMILGVVIGIILINWAVRHGHVANSRSMADASKADQMGIYKPDAAPAAGKQTVQADSIDSLAWHIALIGLAILMGWLALKGLLGAEKLIRGSQAGMIYFFKAFPLFPLCMIGGLLLQKSACAIKLDYLIDHGQMQRIAGASLDFLVVSAIATIQLSVVSANWLPLLILVVAGLVWSVFMLIWVAPKLFKNDWFERGIAEFGQSLGVTATGLLLLRSVDPEGKSSAHESFGYKQLLHEPIMGGGLWTAMALPLVFTQGVLPCLAICCVAFIFWGIIALRIMRRH